MLNFFGLSLMVAFIAVILRVSRQADPVSEETEEVEAEEVEASSNDWVQFRVESVRLEPKGWEPVRVISKRLIKL